MSVCLSKVLEYEGKIENILENIFCIETVWTPKIFDILYYLTKISCQVHLKHVFRVNFEVRSGYGGPFRSVPVRSGPFLLVNAPKNIN